MNATLDAVRLALRISTPAFDDEIKGIIAACKQDLKNIGISKIDETDPLILRAIILYSKANFGYSEDSEKYQRAYDLLKGSLCLAGDYIAQME